MTDMWRPIINVDVDGVLYDFTGAMRREVSTVMGIPHDELPEPNQWSIHKDWPITGKQFHSLMYDGIAMGRIFRHGEFIREHDAIAGLSTLIEVGWHVRIVTSKTFRDPFITMQARKNTLDWLLANDVPHHSLAFTDSTIGKISLRADAIVDDKPRTGDWAQWGADNFLFAQPWNVKHEGPHDQINRITDLMSVSEILRGVPV